MLVHHRGGPSTPSPLHLAPPVPIFRFPPPQPLMRHERLLVHRILRPPCPPPARPTTSIPSFPPPPPPLGSPTPVPLHLLLHLLLHLRHLHLLLLLLLALITDSPRPTSPALEFLPYSLLPFAFLINFNSLLSLPFNLIAQHSPVFSHCSNNGRGI